MPSDFADFKREPSSPHQCMHTYDDGRRCRARAMHNNYMCFAHRDKNIPPVYENEPFEIPTNLTRPTIQHALGELAALLASNRMDLKRAGLLAYILQVASTNLRDPAPILNPPRNPPSSPSPSSPQPRIHRTRLLRNV